MVTRTRIRPGSISRRGLAATALILPVLSVLVGCGGPAGGSPTEPTAANPVPAAASADPTPSAPVGSSVAFGASFGVDRVRWPGTLNGARSVLKAMPKELAGEKGREYYNSGAGEDPPARDAGLVFGEYGYVSVSEEYVSRDTPSGKPELYSANNQLSASFGLMYGCAKGSYRGTAPKPSYPHGGPAVTRRPLTRSVWFSCRIDGAEGDDNFSGYAVGWTRQKTAWLVVAQDKNATRTIVTALRDAAQ